MEAILNINEKIIKAFIVSMIALMVMVFAYQTFQTHIGLSKTRTTIDYASYGNDTVVFPKEWSNW